MLNETPPSTVGRRIREIRSWRNLTVEATAHLAGFSTSYLSRIERNERPVDRRGTLEAFARALRVSPSELTGDQWTVNPDGSEAHAGVVAIEAALDSIELGEDPGEPVRSWPEIAADIARLQHLTHVASDYEGQGRLAPSLLVELHGAYVRYPQHRTDVLLGMIHAFSSAAWVAKRLGGRGLAPIAARMSQRCAEELGSPQWRGYAGWLRGDAAGQLSRPLQLRRAVAVADELRAHLDDTEVQQAYGMLHLSAALAAAAQGDRDTTTTHLDEAEAVAARMGADVGTFGYMWFGAVNVGVWRTSLMTEFGDGARVAEVARGVRIDAIPSSSRRAEFYCDFGRSLLQGGKATGRGEGMAMLLHAEKLAQQRVHNDVFVREAVSAEVQRARRDAVGVEIRGLAYRMGLAA